MLFCILFVILHAARLGETADRESASLVQFSDSNAQHGGWETCCECNGGFVGFAVGQSCSSLCGSKGVAHTTKPKFPPVSECDSERALRICKDHLAQSREHLQGGSCCVCDNGEIAYSPNNHCTACLGSTLHRFDFISMDDDDAVTATARCARQAGLYSLARTSHAEIVKRETCCLCANGDITYSSDGTCNHCGDVVEAQWFAPFGRSDVCDNLCALELCVRRQPDFGKGYEMASHQDEACCVCGSGQAVFSSNGCGVCERTSVNYAEFPEDDASCDSLCALTICEKHVNGDVVVRQRYH